MESSRVKKPLLKDLNADNITENTVLVNSSCEDLRMRFVMERLVSHLHDFARETRLSTKEWMAGIQFLTAVGQSCNDVRQVGSGQGPAVVY
jgi:Catechol dioxygenase N terminus